MLSVTQRGWDGIRVCVCGKAIAAMWNGSVLFCGTVLSYLFRCNNIELRDDVCLFRCDNIEFSVQIRSGSVCWDVERISILKYHKS